MPDEVGLHFLQRNSDFSAAGLGDKTVPKILEPGSMLFQVDENRDLPTFAVCDELDSSHMLIFPHSSVNLRLDVSQGVGEPPKSVGEFTIPVRPHMDVAARLKVVIEKEAVAALVA